MASDHVYYCDFSAEIPLRDWEVLQDDGSSFVLKKKVTTDGGKFLLLSAVNTQPDIRELGEVETLSCGGRVIPPKDRLAYVAPAVLRREFPLDLPPGEVELVVSGRCGQTPMWHKNFTCALTRPMSKVSSAPEKSFRFSIPPDPLPEPLEMPEDTMFTPGIGTEHLRGPGRFGFSKGDGVLDCAMPSLGNVDKLYLLGHPAYKKCFRWNYSTLPEGAARHGSFPPANHTIEGDKITVNHLSCRWESTFSGKAFSCTYSLASPGIITENETGIMRLSDLEFAGNYQYLLIPRPGGELEVTSLRHVQDLTMGENFLLLFGCTEFPDLPLLLVFRQKPEAMHLTFDPDSNRLTEITFSNCPLIITATPFGIESFQPIAPDDRTFLERAARKCRFWSRALLAYPVDCEEYFANSDPQQQVTILEKFTYRHIQDEWGTEPLELAPIPPAATLAGNTLAGKIRDFDFPTKFGYLQGWQGRYAMYRIPMLPPYRTFPLRDAADTRLPAMLKSGMDAYWRVATAFPETLQSYPYAGALLEPFALVSSQMQFLDAADREKMRELLKQRLQTACDPDHNYDYPVIEHAFMMATMPEDQEAVDYIATRSRKKLYNWYERFEPFTGTVFTICYLNVCFFSNNIIHGGDKDEIRDLRIPLIENDWGVGLTFYYMYLSAMASGSFQPIREHWDLLKSVFSFFEKMHDWACMGTGFSDNAILWVEGANYGAFTSMIHLAKAVGDTAAYQKARYMAAKQFALRSAVFRSSQHYFCKYFQVEPWYITKFFEEEQCIANQHTCVPPNLGELRFRDDGIYNLTTEGIYPELFEGLRRLLPEDTKQVMDLLRQYCRTLPDNTRQFWHLTQQYASLLTYMAHSPDFTREDLAQTIAEAREKHCWMGKWRGIHIFSRRLPEHFFETLLYAWDAAKHHPCSIVHHQEILLDDAVWTGENACIRFRLSGNGGQPLITFQLRKEPSLVLLNGRILSPENSTANILEIPLTESGTLELAF